MSVSFCGKRIVLTRSCLFKTTKRKYGYIILLPEIGEDVSEKNPLMKDNGLPEFNTFTIERNIAAIGKQTVLFEEAIRNVEETLQNKEDVDIVKDVLNPIEEAYIPMDTTWGISKTLYFGNQSLMPTKYFISIHNRVNKAKVCRASSKPIFNACKGVLANKGVNLSDAHMNLVKKMAVESKISGLDISRRKDRDSFDYASMRVSQRRTEFQKKLKHVTGLFYHQITNPNAVRDFPQDYLKMIAADPSNPREGPWKVTLQPHILHPFMEYCPNRELRWNVWQASVTRCYNDSDNTSIRTSKALEDIRAYRIIMARAVGYKSYSHMCMETKMAGSLENVYDVMNTLMESARPAQQEELENLTEFAIDRGFDGHLEEWDLPYWGRKHRRSILNIKEEIVRDYFPLPHVLKTLFELVETLFQVRIVEDRKTDVWHADVRFFDVIDLRGSSSEPIASFYFDPYARRDFGLRMEKDAGWMMGIQNRCDRVSNKPIAAMIFNFQRPTSDKPSLLSFNDVAILFQKFGHAMQHLLTQVGIAELAGTSGLEWDAVGISGHFMENWLYEESMIRRLSSHYATSEPLPEETINNLKHIRSHMAGYNLSKQIYLGKFDLKLHELDDYWEDIIDVIWDEHFVIPRDKLNEHICSWDAIFGGEWAAAIYSDLWSTMVAADAYSAFQEIPAGNSDLVQETASRYRDTVLSLGGSYPASEIFRRFRGRDPSPKALLKNLGLKKKGNDCIE